MIGGGRRWNSALRRRWRWRRQLARGTERLGFRIRLWNVIEPVAFGLRRQDLADQTGALEVDRQRAIEPFLQFDFCLGVTPTWPSGRDVDAQATELDGVIVGHDAAMLETKELVVVSARGAWLPRWSGVIGRHGEVTVVAGQKAGED